MDAKDRLTQLEHRVEKLEAQLPDGVNRRDALKVGSTLGFGALLGGGGAMIGTNQTLTDTLESKHYNYITSYFLKTDGSSIDALSQRNELSEYIDEKDIGPLLETLIIDELPPKGDPREAAGMIYLASGKYPGKLSNGTYNGVPLPTSCQLIGEGETHRDPNYNKPARPQTIPLTELHTDDCGFIQPPDDGDTGPDYTVFPHVEKLMLIGPGQPRDSADTAGGTGFQSQNSEQMWDWLCVRDCVVQQFQEAVDFRNSHKIYVENSHFIDFGELYDTADRSVWTGNGIYCRVPGSTIEIPSKSESVKPIADPSHKWSDNNIYLEQDGSNGIHNSAMWVKGENVRIRGNTFSNLAGPAGSAICAEASACTIIDNYFHHNSTWSCPLGVNPKTNDMVVAFNQDHSASTNSLKIDPENAGEVRLYGNYFPNGVNYNTSVSNFHVFFEGIEFLNESPPTSYYGPEHAGLTIIDESASPPHKYLVKFNGTVVGPF